jgi:hypothetical protein
MGSTSVSNLCDASILASLAMAMCLFLDVLAKCSRSNCCNLIRSIFGAFHLSLFMLQLAHCARA